MVRKFSKLFKLIMMIAVFGVLGLFGSSLKANADSIIYNGAGPSNTALSSYSNQPALQRAVYFTINGETSNYGGTSRQSLIDANKWVAAGKPNIDAHIYLKNNNPAGGASIQLNQLLRFPKDFNANAPFVVAGTGNPVTEGRITGDTQGITLYQPYPTNVQVNGTLAPGKAVDVAVPLKYDQSSPIRTSDTFQLRENNWSWNADQGNFDGTSIYFRFAIPMDEKTYPDFMNGQYLVTYKDQDGYYRQATDVQSLMPQFNLNNDIEIDNVYKGLGTNDGSNFYSNATYRVLGDQMNAANGQKFWDMLQTRGYAPVWYYDHLLTYESFTANVPGSLTPGNPDYFKYMHEVLSHNGIGGINWQVVKVLVADNATVNRGTKWNPLDHVTLYDPTKQNNSDSAKIPVTKDNVKVTSDNGHINADGTLDTSTPGVYNVTYTYEAVYSDSVKRTITKTIQVTVPGRTPSPVNPTPNPTPTPTPSNPNWNPSSPTKGDGTTGLPNYAGVKGSAVYATKKIYMYKHATFKKSQRIATYPKAARTNRPMFVIVGYDRSNGGALRYKVRDVNHNKKTAGKVGYITANRKYVVNVYYKSMPKNKTITVISKKGVHAYKNKNLTGKTKSYKKGTHLKVKKFIGHNLTTRYQLSNGYYVTANKKLVIQGKY